MAQTVSDHSPRYPGPITSQPMYVFVVDKGALRQGFRPVLRFPRHYHSANGPRSSSSTR